MRWNPQHISLDTLIAASPLLGHELEDRRRVSQGQHPQLTGRFGQHGRPLRDHSQRDLFCVAPLDLLVSRHGDRPQFHLLELNGTGIGGITNLPEEPLECILRSLAESSQSFDTPDGIVLLAVSGKESEAAPRMNRLMHEKLLFVEAVRHGLRRRHFSSQASNLRRLAAEPRCRLSRPTVVLGYIKDLLNALALESDGGLSLHGRPVMGAVNDRFCANVLSRFGRDVDLNQFQTINRCFAAGADKGIAYDAMNSYLRGAAHPCAPREVRSQHARCRIDLIEIVLEWLASGRQVVIKPHGTGLGHGIEFFLNAHQPIDDVVEQIDRSLDETEEFYGMPGGAFPYTVCEYIDAPPINAPGYELDGHKFELRVVVYRHGNTLRAFPSVAKVARERYQPGSFCRRALINNITASGDTSKVCGTDYTLPLCNRRTLEVLDLTPDDIDDLCQLCTGYVGHVLDSLQQRPERFGLPSHRATALAA